MRQKGIKMKLFILICIIAVFSGCEQDLVGPTNTSEDPTVSGEFRAILSMAMQGETEILVDSTSIVPVKKGVPTMFSGRRSTGDSIVNAWICFAGDEVDCIYQIETFKTFNTVGDTFVVSLKLWQANGDTTNSWFRIYIVDFHGPGGSGDISLKSTTLYANGMREYKTFNPKSRLPVGVDLTRPVYIGPLTDWKNKKFSAIETGVYVMSEKAFDGKRAIYNYLGDSLSTIWSDAETSQYYSGEDNLYEVVYFGGNIYNNVNAPEYVLPGIGDTILRVYSRNDTVIASLNNACIPGIQNNTSTKPKAQIKKYTATTWPSKKDQKLIGSTGWGECGIKITNLDSTHIIQVKYWQGSTIANMTACFAYDPVTESLLFAFIPGDGIYLINREDNNKLVKYASLN